MKFASQTALLLLCDSVCCVVICMATFRVQRFEADSEMKDIQLLLQDIQRIT